MNPRFCADCGGRLPDGARFCPQCGVGIRSADAAPPAREPRGWGERREVVVLFADLAGYTSLSSRLDPEDVHRLLGRYFAVVDGIVASYGGTIDKHIGDAVMALFGAPVAHGNDAERAVRAACDIHVALAALARDAGAMLSAHIGIASGEVVAADTGSSAHSAYTVTGDAVNLAARLEGMAKGGETLVAAPVWHAVAAFCDGDAAGALDVKGLDRPVGAWRVHRCRAAAVEQPPLVGRNDELRQFEAALASVADKRAGRFLLLRGEAGIGKTRLVEALAERARAAGFACHTALVLDFGVARGRGAIAALVAGLLGAPPVPETDAREAALRQAVADSRVPGDDEGFLRDLLELRQPQHLQASYEAMEPAARSRGRHAALGRLVAGAALEQPRLLVVEDLHWADALTLDGLAALARTCTTSPALLVATTRIEGDPVDARWRGGVGPLPQLTLDLDRLAPDESLALAHALAGDDERRVLDCIRRAEGNPLFLVQLLRDAGASAVPGSIRSLVVSRIDRLAAVDRDAAQAAAVIGQRFSLPLLRRLIDVDDYDCDALVRHFLVRPEGDEYLFAHALIREGAYASLLNARKRELHERAAAWYAGRDAGLHAQHLDRAGDPGAAAAYVAAAREQAAMLRVDAALALAERAVALATDPGVRHHATMLRAEQLRDVGRTRESVEAFEAAALQAPDDAARCRALIGVAAGHRLAGAPDAALAALAKAQPLAAARGLERDASEIHYLRGNLHFARGEVAECRAEHEAALACARHADDARAQANALSGLGDACYAQGRMRSGFERFAECVALARAHDLPRIESANLCMMAHCNGFLCRWDEALRSVEEAVSIARRLALPHAQMFALESLALVRLNRGEGEPAASAAEESLKLARDIGSRRFEAILLWVLGRLAIRSGDRDAARRHYRDVRTIMETTGIGGFIGPLLCAGEAQVAGAADDVRRALAEGASWLERGSLGHCHYWFRADAIDAALALGDADAALHHCDALAAYAAAEPLPWSDFHVARGRALVAWRQRPDDAARARLESLRTQGAELGLSFVLPG
ncbi:MAG TPA: adenylate/guanylate cyclase domain-containing protein [Casimicrobiaceae bacterium]|nr:adenylate/guanylate cyclase domain-containing protein [Casimicrobiaceae bacterium]